MGSNAASEGEDEESEDEEIARIFRWAELM